MTITRTLSLAFVLGIGLTLGCGDKEDDTATDDTSVTDDTSSTDDSSADDTGSTELSFSGTVTLTTTEDGAVVCDLDVDLVGTDFTGNCADCDWAFDMEGSAISEDRSSSDCVPYWQLSYLPYSYYTDIFMGHFPAYYGYYGTYYNAFMTGYGIDYSYYYYPGPYWSFNVYYDGSTSGTFSQSGGDISWTWDYAGYDYEDAYYYYCDYFPSSYAYSVYDEGTSGTSDLDCDGLILDVWTFTGDGNTVNLAIDTVGDSTAFDPHFWVNDGDECTVAYADDSFDCTFEPAAYQCPAITFTSNDGEEYQVVVASYGSCNGTEAEYQLNLEIESGDTPTLAYDNVDADIAFPYTIHAEGSGTITGL
ncbi:MAG: hypothetical protein H6739_26140 [Alphaproteobacteria bacterium]|nr:hypothetical protein [Alphaproteobacteria bacterium]